MRRWTGSSRVKIMACSLFIAKSLSKPMITYQSHPKEQTDFNDKIIETIFHKRNYIQSYRV